VLLLEVKKGQRGRQFEERGMQRLKETAFLGHEVDDTLLGDRLPVDAYAFAEVHKMGRCVQPNLVACGL